MMDECVALYVMKCPALVSTNILYIYFFTDSYYSDVTITQM